MTTPKLFTARRNPLRHLAVAIVGFCALLGTGCHNRRDRAAAQCVDLEGRAVNPISSVTNSVVIFVRPDCPISNRYAPEIRRLANTFSNRFAIWLVYPDAELDTGSIRKHVAEFSLPGTVVRDPHHVLVKQLQARVTPEAAVLQGTNLVYHGRIDDRYVALGTDRGTATRHELEVALGAIVAGKPLAVSYEPAVGCAIGTAR